jgi:hypothetical protein
MTETQQKTAGVAIASLVLAILSFTILFFIGPLLAIGAVICGHIGLSRIKKNPEGLKGGGIALAGLIMGYVNIGFAVVMLALTAVAMPSFVQARDTAQQYACINNMRMIDAGKEQGALEYRWARGQQPDVDVVNTFIKGDATPLCPSGGIYTYNAIGVAPECAAHGSLPGYDSY